MSGRLRAVVCAMAMGFAVVACTSTVPPSTTRVTAIDAPVRAVAGDIVSVEVTAVGDGDVRLAVIDAFVTTTMTATPADGVARFELPAAITRSAGNIGLTASGALGDPVTDSTLILPAAGVDPLDVLVGPRTVVADGADQTMAIGFINDRFGNPLLDGTPVSLSLVDEAGVVTVLDTAVDRGLAARLIGSGTVAQRVEVFASLDSLASRRVDFHEVPGPAAVVEIVSGETDERTASLVADGRSLALILTAELFDRFGNRLPDGHLVRLRSDGPDGIGQYTARTIDGVARFEVVSPRVPGTVEFAATVDGTSSEPLELDFAPAISDLPVVWGWEDDVLMVSIGPVLDDRGAVVVDGTPAAVDVSGVDSAPLDVELIDGRADVEFESNERIGVGTINVEVLGVDANGTLS